LAEARELIRQLNAHVTQPEQQLAGDRAHEHWVYGHQWRQDDLVIYDNRCCLHRGRPWTVAKGALPSLPRDMVRTTLMGGGETQGSVASSLCTTVHPLYTRFANINYSVSLFLKR
jgi:alpha-ketoglutarate-dependent 2,4-dichlorophenoxyacetate dioxygenase